MSKPKSVRKHLLSASVISESPSTACGEIPASILKCITAGDYASACGALATLPRSPLRRHLLGVCLLRAGRIGEAIDVFRTLALNVGTTVVRLDADDLLRINYAAAILLSGKPGGALAILSELKNQHHSEAIAIRAAIGQWSRGLSFWRRLDWWLTGIDPPNANVPYSELPGILPVQLPTERPVAPQSAESTAPPVTPPHLAA